MHTVEILDEAIQAAQALGYQVRQEWLTGAGGGGCEIKGRKHLFINVAMSVPDQLHLVLDVLHREGADGRLKLSHALKHALVVCRHRTSRAA